MNWQNRTDRSLRQFDVVAYRSPKARREIPLEVLGPHLGAADSIRVRAVLDQDVYFAPDSIKISDARLVTPFIRWEESGAAVQAAREDEQLRKAGVWS